jgi:DNA-directed RNA polymerase subunit RPC12/RpoP
MSEFLQFKCHTCGNTFDLYEKNMRKGMNIVCPHCYANVPPAMANRAIEAELSLKDVNYHFRKYNEERGTPLFSVSVIGVHTDDSVLRRTLDL